MYLNGRMVIDSNLLGKEIFMNQIPCAAPIYNPYALQNQANCMPVPQKTDYNAVKIDVHNPSVSTPGLQPTAPIYDYPKGQIYGYPQGQVPVCYPPVVGPVYYPPVPQTPTTEVPQQPVPPVVVTQQPVQEPAQVPAPVIVDQPKPAPAAPTAPEAPETAPVQQTPEVVPAEPVAPQVDLNTFISKLTNPDFEVQAEGMKDISDLIKKSPEQAADLVDSKVFDALTNIVNFDSSNLEEASEEQKAVRAKVNAGGNDVTEQDKEFANKIVAPKELADRNKSFALFATALLQKVYGDEVARLSNSTVPLTELPGIMTVVDSIKDNPNPTVRASAIDSLSYIQRPEYKNDLATVFSIAQNDSDADVADAAKAALDKLNQI